MPTLKPKSSFVRLRERAAENFWLICPALIGIELAVLGWQHGGWIGLIVAILADFFLAGFGFAAAFIYAMSLDNK